MWTSKSTQFHYLINKHSNVYLEKQFFQALRVCKFYAQIFFCAILSAFPWDTPFLKLAKFEVYRSLFIGIAAFI